MQKERSRVHYSLNDKHIEPTNLTMTLDEDTSHKQSKEEANFLENNAICYFVNWLYIRTHNIDYLSVLLWQYQTFSSTHRKKLKVRGDAVRP